MKLSVDCKVVLIIRIVTYRELQVESIESMVYGDSQDKERPMRWTSHVNERPRYVRIELYDGCIVISLSKYFHPSTYLVCPSFSLGAHPSSDHPSFFVPIFGPKQTTWYDFHIRACKFNTLSVHHNILTPDWSGAPSGDET